jgi:hypothetical protein
VALIAAVDLHWGHRLGIAEGAVRPLLVVEAEEVFQVGVDLDLGLVAPEVDLVVFDRAPEPFPEDVVEATALAVHPELYAQREQRLAKLGRGELAASCVAPLPH